MPARRGILRSKLKSRASAISDHAPRRFACPPRGRFITSRRAGEHSRRRRRGRARRRERRIAPRAAAIRVDRRESAADRSGRERGAAGTTRARVSRVARDQI
eukprot:22149-Pelagococcus_subviridis.AAC.5